jgi:tagatose-1,6-bisphosphate aldolase
VTEVAPVAARTRRLLRLADPDGVVAGIALDHRDSFRTVLRGQGLDGITDDEIQRLKRALTRALLGSATAIMIDAELGSAALEDAVDPSRVGVIMPLEAQGYEAQGDRRLTSLLRDFSPATALAMGAAACKLLLPYRVDDAEAADHQDAVLRGAVAACHAAGLPLVVEPVVHRRSDETLDAHEAAYPALVIDAVRRIQPLGADLLKLPFPLRHADPGDRVAADACAAIAHACAGTPWVLLGGGADIDTYVRQIRIAGEAGASGFLAGRGIWAPVLRRDPGETERLATDIARPAFERCRDAARAVARPLTVALAA